MSANRNKQIGSTMKYNRLGSTPLLLSVIGLGGSAFGGCFGEISEDQAKELIQTAFDLGINYIDTAPYYGLGKSERILGKVLQAHDRDTFYISTKVGRYGEKSFDYTFKRTRDSVLESLDRLKLDYIDLVQIHDIEFSPSLDLLLTETLPALERLKEEGKIRYIGITGYPLQLIKDLIDLSPVRIDSLISYCHYCVFNKTLQDFIPYFKSKGIGVINAAPLGMGLLCKGGPPSWHPAPDTLKETCARVVNCCEESGVSLPKLALHSSVTNHDISSTVVSVTNVDMLLENQNALLALNLKEKEMLTRAEEIFKQELDVNHWEGVEIERFKKKK